MQYAYPDNEESKGHYWKVSIDRRNCWSLLAERFLCGLLSAEGYGIWPGFSWRYFTWLALSRGIFHMACLQLKVFHTWLAICISASDRECCTWFKLAINSLQRNQGYVNGRAFCELHFSLRERGHRWSHGLQRNGWEVCCVHKYRKLNI